MVNFRVLLERNLAASCVIIFCAFGVLYGASTSLPGLLQSLFGYDAYVSGLVQSPAGLFSILVLLVVGTLIGRGIDARWLATRKNSKSTSMKMMQALRFKKIGRLRSCRLRNWPCPR